MQGLYLVGDLGCVWADPNQARRVSEASQVPRGDKDLWYSGVFKEVMR